MGITLHYHGRFNPQADLQLMIEEVKDIATAFQWPYFVFDTAFDPQALGLDTYDTETLWGISLTPPGSEPVHLSFLSNGRMSSVINLQAYGKDTNPKTTGYIYKVFTKTQFAGPEAHKMVVNILRHISQKYLLDFHVTDESNYWETGDEAALQQQFGFMNGVIQSFRSAVEYIPRNEGEELEAYIQRMMQHAQQQHSKDQ